MRKRTTELSLVTSEPAKPRPARPRPAKLSLAIASLACASLGLALAAPAAGAAPTAVSLRVEGSGETLFEGPIATEGHDVEATSDTKPRSCDGINPNDPENLTPGPTATAAAVDAMGLLGETFDGSWFEGFDDYLITRWGPDRAREGEAWYVLVNYVLSNRGGCQYELREGAQVVWAEVPSPSKLLLLYPAGSAAAAPPLTATAVLGAPFAVEVDYEHVKEGKPPLAPERAGLVPYAGAKVAPVQTSADGTETVQIESPAAVTTNGEGKASVAFTEPGWHRIKASLSTNLGGVVRSNRLDVCVPPNGASGCGGPPPEDLLRSPHKPEAGSGGEGGQQTGTQSFDGTAAGAAVGLPPQGGAAGATPSVSSVLRIDGFSLVPLDVRARELHFAGRWRRIADPGAWHGAVAVGTAGATLAVRLAAGRPVFVVRDARGARVEVRAGRRRQTFLLRDARRVVRLLIGRRRPRTGVVSLRVLSGEVGIDGVAVVP